ncbi:LysR family transcriptional regulator [Oleomonas cavernae]|uniref:LysR family transcriptional regulator n=1 Tax=Oleomonas cavernae TaxID=2320859 RepID=A0A418WU45_9PROT|nr:LysR family transcriptional regulator [Oleomonas cavernae]RJF94696.1 LysR family transcriptional regulator [Oleomonas cavernae]
MALIENIRVFVRVLELGSLSAAGRHMRLSPAVVSHRLQQLEAHLGVRLLNRTTRRVKPTEHGSAFYEACQDVLATLERAEATVADAGRLPRGTLRITAPLGFGRQILAPILPDFREAHPEVSVQLRLSDHVLDLLAEGMDVALRMGTLADSSLIARKIADCPQVLCAAPAYLKRHGTPAEPADLLKHACLILRLPGARPVRWVLSSPDGPVTLAVSGPVDADFGEILTEFALRGHGVVMKPLWEVADYLRDGRLVPVLPDFPPPPISISVVYPHRRLVAAKTRAFADFILDRGSAAILEAIGEVAEQKVSAA